MMRSLANFEQRVAAARAVRIEDEARRLGIDVVGKSYQGPCPVCGGVDRFWINIARQAFACRKCGVGGDVIALVQHVDGASFAEALNILTGESDRPARAPVPPPDASLEKIKDKNQLASWLWSKRQNIAGTVAETYLRGARGITCPLPPTLGFLPSYKNGPPSMIAAFGIAREVEPGVILAPRAPEIIHRTFLRPDGSGKIRDEDAPKNADGKPIVKFVTGLGFVGPIVIAPPSDLLSIAITEGIEDALSVHEATGMGAWAAGTAGNLPKVAAMVPDWVECVTLFEHPDKDGRRKVQEAAEMLIDRGIEVYVDEGVAR